jgi:tetratricopeptide (TPR) repeat protein
MAMIALQRGQTNYAIGKFHDALTLQERIRDTLGITSALNNIATIYFKQGSPTKAIEYFERSLRLHRIRGNREGVVRISANLSTVYSMMKEFDKALGLAKLCLEFREKENDPTELALCYNQIGSIYKRMGRPEESMKFFQKSLALYEQLQNPIELSHVNYNISFLYLEKKEYAMAGKHALKSLKLAQEVRNPDNVSRAAQVLYSVAKARGESKTALDMFETYITARDSLYNEQTRKSSIRSQLKYEYEKQAAADSVARAKERDVKNAELARRNAEIRAKKNQQYALFGGLGLVMVFAGFMFNRFKITQKQKKIIEQQKSEVEEQKKLVELKQKEVLDSIRYAKRIQMAHMTGERIIAQALMRMRRE